MNETCADQNPQVLSELVTIVLNFQTYPQEQLDFIRSTLKHIGKVFPNMNITVAVPQEISIKEMKNLQRIDVATEDAPGAIWNNLVRNVKTRYVLLARDLADFKAEDALLERLVREMSPLDLNIIGGAVRTHSNGRWSHGCYNLVYKNYTLQYKLGYKRSLHDCLYCQSIRVPFLARTDFMKTHKFDESLPEQLVFNDFFIELFKHKTEVGVCPDSMFYVRDEATHVLEEQEWLLLAQKRKLLTILPPGGTKVDFRCDDVNLPVKIQDGVINPPCLLQV